MMRLSVTVGFRGSQHTHRPHPASLPVRVPMVVSLLSASFRLTSWFPPCGFAMVVVTTSSYLLSGNKFWPMSGTLGWTFMSTEQVSDQKPTPDDNTHLKPYSPL